LNWVGWLGMGLVLVALAIRIGSRVGVRAIGVRAEQFAFYLALAGLVCVLAYALSQWREIAKLFARRQARYGTLAGVSIVVVLGILVAINYIGAKQNKRWDLTANKQFSLADQSRNVLSKLDSPLQIRVFAQDTEFQRYRDRLKEYEYASKNVSTEYIDPDRKPTVARQYQIQQYGTILFDYKGRTERVTSDSEQDLTNGIIKVVSGQQKKVYFTQGHGERDTASSEREGYNQASASLGRENYTVDKVVVAQTSAIPDDAAVVVVAGPRTDFFAPEIDAIKMYLAKGGKLLLELDPPDNKETPALTNLIALAHEWGIDVGNDVVVDASGVGRLIGADFTVPVSASYPSHPITQRFNSVLTAYPLARSVTAVSGGVGGHTAQPFVETSPRSWAEKDIVGLLSGKPPQFEESKGDKQGPISIGAAASASVASTDTSKPPATGDQPKPETRVVVLGDSDFPANNVLKVAGNQDFFMNIIGWLSQQENLISIRPKEADDRRITLTATQQNNITLLSLLIIPAFIFGSGVYTWWRRR
jgi:ABC-type uncharacterized transport system involved in gliding motility auxiliary subunit